VFDRAIAGLEAAKREDFPKETLNTWFSIMSNRNWTNGFFLEKVRIVLDSKQYGGVKFDSFIEGKGFYTVYESNEMALRIIERRKSQLEAMQLPTKQIEQEGLIDVQIIYQNRIRFEQDKQRIIKEKKAKSVEMFIRKAPEETKKELFKILRNKNLLNNDEPFWKEILHLFAPYLIEEVQEMIEGNKNENHV
jgi:hypothetical protein